jgi:ribonucleotide reductase alpha subunit
MILVEGIEQITKILQSREGKKLRSVDVLDICNIIGSIVVAGNVRRSAEIALGDSDDVLFLRAKRWDLGSIPNTRRFSNNTIYADSYDYLLPEFWDGYKGNGEPYGLFNLSLSQTQGRLGEFIEDQCEMLNPCGEQTLESYECCNLAEIPLNNVRSLEELKEIARLLYKTQKAVAAMPYIYEQTEKIVHKNMRLGQSITGITQSLDKLVWLDETYEYLREFDDYWSAENGWNKSIKLTCVKPSGTVSLLTGSTPGVHPAFAKYYIRRVQVASDSPLVAYMNIHGYHTEYLRKLDGTFDYTTKVIEFPVYFERAVYAKDMTAVRQLELVRAIQEEWSDNAVSVTVYYRKEEIPEIQKWLQENYETSVKSVSFLLHSDHGFDQAPYEEITEEQYNTILDNLFELTPFNDYVDMSEDECVSGLCPVR